MAKFWRRHRPDVRPDSRLRFVLFRPSGSSFTIDAVVADAGTGRLGAPGDAVTLRLHRPAAYSDAVDIEQVLRQWADEDRLVDVTIAEDTTVTALRAEGSRMRLHLVA